MGVICFASLKGGVGKTSLSVNTAHAFAERGCQTLLIDCDPMAHATRFFLSREQHQPLPECPTARLFFSPQAFAEDEQSENLIDTAFELGIHLVKPVREEFDLIPASNELRHFLWGKGARAFRALFPRLIDELRGNYDHIIIDTPPDWNIITRNCIACSELVIVPVDSSEMSIYALEEIVSSSAHIQGPAWAIIRSMVNRQASRVQELSTSRLRQNLQNFDHVGGAGEEPNIEDPSEFISLLRKREEARKKSAQNVNSAAPVRNESPIYLLNSLVYRTEQQNKLTFLGRTALDSRSTAKLAQQYIGVAREVEQILSLSAGDEPEMEGTFFAGYAEPNASLAC